MIFYLLFGLFLGVKTPILAKMIKGSLFEKNLLLDQESEDQEDLLPRIDHAKPGWSPQDFPLALCEGADLLSLETDLEALGRKKGFFLCPEVTNI